MCGITGFLSVASHALVQPEQVLQNMANEIISRGPDAQGYWLSDDKAVAFAHRRLAVVDLSEAGQQPMESRSYVLIFNGEIYNFRRIRQDLEALGHIFRGHSDTETLLFALEQWGVDITLNKLEGMFAFCAFHKTSRRSFLVRDRLGEKPLYYSLNRRKQLIFGSELKALKAHPHFKASLNHAALNLYFKHNCIPAPHTIYENTYKLKPGHYLSVDFQHNDALNLKEHCYWSASDTFINGAQKSFTGTPSEAADQLEVILNKSIKDQMLADVPIGAFLSGGIDSSTITALMQKQSGRSINTFSIGFDFHDFNEAEHAKAIAKHLGTTHTEMYVSEQDTRNVIPMLPRIYDEPFADSSQIPTFLVSKMAKQHVTVALSGDGGDELFAGYSRYSQTLANWQQLNQGKGQLKTILSRALCTLPNDLIDAILRPVLAINRQYAKHSGVRLKANAHIAQSKTLAEYYSNSIAFWHPNSELLAKSLNADYSLNAAHIHDIANTLSPLNLLQYLDTQMYLPDDILTKVDRAGMAVSLESRIPMLNHNVVEFAATLPDNIKTFQGKAKWPLQEILSRHVPRKLFERPKQGFAIPIGEWLKGPLKEWMMDLLNHDRLKRQGILNHQAIIPLLDMHMDGNSDYSLNLWSVLMLQAWLDEQEFAL
jgi:asparagine synthase (glutamine-hydrolysing)